MTKPIMPALTDDKVLRHVKVGKYKLLLWDTGRHRQPNHSALGYAFYELPEVPLFIGEDFGCPSNTPIDSDECLRSLLGFLTLRPGDTDPEYFEEYSPDQLDFCATEAEELAYLYADDEAPEPFEDIE